MKNVITLIVTVIYVILPADIIPDVIPFFGCIDDAAAAIYAGFQLGRTLRGDS